MQTLREFFPYYEDFIVDELFIVFSGIVFSATTISIIKFFRNKSLNRGTFSLWSTTDGSERGSNGNNNKKHQEPICTHSCNCCKSRENKYLAKLTRFKHESCSEETPSGENNCNWNSFEVWSFFCPISNQLIEEPVISKYGHIYEKKSI